MSIKPIVCLVTAELEVQKLRSLHHKMQRRVPVPKPLWMAYKICTRKAFKIKYKGEVFSIQVLFFLRKITYKTSQSLLITTCCIFVLFCFNSNCVYVFVNYKLYALLDT